MAALDYKNSEKGFASESNFCLLTSPFCLLIFKSCLGLGGRNRTCVDLFPKQAGGRYPTPSK